MNELALTRLTVVVQDWGGPIGLRLAVERPELVDRIVLLNTGIGAGGLLTRMAAVPRLRAPRRRRARRQTA